MYVIWLEWRERSEWREPSIGWFYENRISRSFGRVKDPQTQLQNYVNWLERVTRTFYILNSLKTRSQNLPPKPSCKITLIGWSEASDANLLLFGAKRVTRTTFKKYKKSLVTCYDRFEAVEAAPVFIERSEWREPSISWSEASEKNDTAKIRSFKNTRNRLVGQKTALTSLETSNKTTFFRGARRDKE
jgi:hypothetical protein